MKDRQWVVKAKKKGFLGKRITIHVAARSRPWAREEARKVAGYELEFLSIREK